MPREDPPTPGRAHPSPLPRRPHLDGVRTVAVYLVVAFHAGADRLSGGYLGVDVFFVLSGYLVTALLLRETGTDGRRMDLVRFYSRRARRLLPAAALVLVATALVFPLVATPAEVAESRTTLWSAPLGVANWLFLSRSTDYFATDIAVDPILHFWSLAVEEQFYLVWPWVLLGLARLARRSARPGRALGTALAAGAVAGAAWSLITAGSPARAHFATDARAYQLLAGAALALVPWPRVARTLARRRDVARVGPTLAAAVGLGVVVATSTPHVPLSPAVKGVVVTGATVLWLAGMDAGPGPVRWLLGRPTMARLGQVSYGTYLWHWLVVIVITRSLDTSNLQTFALAALVSTGLAFASAELIEVRVLTSSALARRARPVLAIAVAGQILLAAVVLPALVGRADASTTELAATGADVGVGLEASEVDWRSARDDIVRHPRCGADDLDECRLVEGGSTHVVLVGDSHANMLAPALLDAAEGADLSLSLVWRSACPWVWRVALPTDDRHGCLDMQDEWYTEVLPALEPDIVISVIRGLDGIRFGEPDHVTPLTDRDGTVDWFDPEDRRTILRQGMEDVVAAVDGMGARLVMIEPTPHAPPDQPPVDCLSDADLIAECRFVADDTTAPTEEVQRDVAEARPGLAVTLDIDRLVCPYKPICDPVVDGEVVLRDDNHLTVAFARTLGDDLVSFLSDQGWLPAG